MPDDLDFERTVREMIQRILRESPHAFGPPASLPMLPEVHIRFAYPSAPAPPVAAPFAADHMGAASVMGASVMGAASVLGAASVMGAASGTALDAGNVATTYPFGVTSALSPEHGEMLAMIQRRTGASLTDTLTQLQAAALAAQLEPHIERLAEIVQEPEEEGEASEADSALESSPDDEEDSS